jgi:hypothetical protein
VGGRAFSDELSYVKRIDNVVPFGNAPGDVSVDVLPPVINPDVDERLESRAVRERAVPTARL